MSTKKGQGTRQRKSLPTRPTHKQKEQHKGTKIGPSNTKKQKTQNTEQPQSSDQLKRNNQKKSYLTGLVIKMKEEKENGKRLKVSARASSKKTKLKGKNLKIKKAHVLFWFLICRS